MKSKYFFRIFNSLFCLTLIWLAFTGSSCNDILNALGSDDVTGSWVMSNQGGSQYDICNGETVLFGSNIATLTCPGSTPITRAYTTSGGVLTYTETGMSYNYTVSSSSGATLLTMTGRNNISRTLEYRKQSSSTDSQSSGSQQKSDKPNSINSSESK